ncbi:hypothetical protein [Methanimicrococcus hongohii]|uniref:hypothetical protein n=1 Tax=Methanimicrococcus hongohii TaxID=3028295 RepID=UPI00292DFBF5|nr:hypothetical protein [Methanimicrococcus sp. Hf6]
MADSSHKKQNSKTTVCQLFFDFCLFRLATVFCCQLPAGPARLQLSLMLLLLAVFVFTWNQVSVSTWSQVSVSTWSQVSVCSGSQVFVSGWSQVSVSACRSGLHCRQQLPPPPREPHQF